MNNWIGSMGCSRQTGFVLPVALLLLVVLTVAAVASMRGTTMQERMAVGQVQMHSSFLDSEQLVWDAAACIRARYVDKDDKFIKSPPEPNVVIAECGASGLSLGAVITHSKNPWLYTVTAARAFADTGAIRPVVLDVITPGGGGKPLPNLAPYACFGSNCALSTAQSAASPTGDGTNRLSVAIGDHCGTQGKGKKMPAANPLATDVPGVIIPEGTIIPKGSVASGASAGFVGDPPVVNNTNGTTWDASIKGYIADPVTYINDVIKSYRDAAVTPIGPLKDGAAGLWIAGKSQTITIDGGGSTVFGVIILEEGGRLEMEGNQCFVGSVLFRTGGQIVAMSGTPATFGSVVGYAGTEVVNPSLSGNPSFYFSDDALDMAAFIAGSDRFDILQWRAPINLSAF
jgi:hypothetical protein